jgi:hypothetical protein
LDLWFGMRVKLPGWLRKKSSGKGSLLPLLAVMAMATLAAAIAVRMRTEGASDGASRSPISPSNGTPAIPLPHRSGPPPGAGV